MPNPFVKLWKYLTASANAQIDQRADPKIQIAQAIEAEQQRHQALANQAAAVLGNQRQLEMRLNRQLGEVEKLQASARQALVLADKTRAGGDAAKAAEYENAAQAFATQLVAAEQSMEDLKRSHDEALQAAEQARGAVEQSRMRLQTTLAERTKLMSQLEQAKMQEHVAALAQAGQRAVGAGQHARACRRSATRSRRGTPTPSGRPSWPRPRSRAGCSRCRRRPSTSPAPPGWTRSAPRWAAARGGRGRRPGRGDRAGCAGRRPAVGRAARGPAGRAARAGLITGAAPRRARPSRRSPVLRGRPRRVGRVSRASPSGRGRPGSPVRASGSTGAVAAWQRGHHQVTRSCGAGPGRPAGSAVRQRRQGLPLRPKTQWSWPRRGSPVVLCSGWCGWPASACARRSTSGGEVGDVGDPRPRVDAAEEQRLDLVEVADAGQVALVEDRDADLLVGVRRAAGAAPPRGPSRGRGRRARGGRPAGPRRRSARSRRRAAGSRRTPTRRWPGPRGRRRPGPPRHFVPGR